MKFPTLEFDQNTYIKDQLNNLEDHINNYHETLNTEGVWLFLATLGCWGVADEGMKKFSFLLTLVIFSYRVFRKLNDTRSFKVIYSQLREEINLSSLSDDTKKARLYDLEKIKSQSMGILKGLKSMPIFFGCYIFTVTSFAMNVQRN